MAEDLEPQAAKPKGKTLWVLGLLLVIGYFMVDGGVDGPRYSFETTVQMPAEIAQPDRHLWQGMARAMMVEVAMAADVPMGQAIKQALSRKRKAGESETTETSETSESTEKPETSLKLTYTDAGMAAVYASGGYDLWTIDFTEPKKRLVFIYPRLKTMIYKTQTLFAASEGQMPRRGSDVIAFFQGLGAYADGEEPSQSARAAKALAYWKDLPLTESGTLMAWLRGQVTADSGDREAAKSFYMRAVSMDPRLSKDLPDWVLGLK